MAMKSIKRYLSSTDDDGTDAGERATQETEGRIDRQARYLAEQICSGFQLHDRRQREESIEAFYAVDRNQFPDLTDDEAFRAAEAYVDALWAKDEIEKRHETGDGEFDHRAVRDADYSPVHEYLRRRADVVGMDPTYAERTTEAWQNHKAGRDYWTPFMAAQTIELRTALGDPDYPDKPRGGQSGFGPLAARYVVGVELHDMHSNPAWDEAIRIMTPYYRRILEAHRD